MSFYQADPENDRSRHIIRQNRYPISRFWGSGSADANFLITGGSKDAQILNLCFAIKSYLYRNGKPVVIIHNDNKLDATLYCNVLQKQVAYMLFSESNRNYQPFYKVSYAAAKRILEGQISLHIQERQEDMKYYMDGFLDLMAAYRQNPSLYDMWKICAEGDAQIQTLAARAGVFHEIGTKLSRANAGQMKQLLEKLMFSAKNIYGDLKQVGRDLLPWDMTRGQGASITSCMDCDSPCQVISIKLGTGDTESLSRYLAEELKYISERQFLLVLFDTNINERNGWKDLLIDRQKNFSYGFCSGEISGMFQDGTQDSFVTLTDSVQKRVILHYDGAQTAEKITRFAGKYIHEHTVEVIAPKNWWEIWKAKAPGKAKAEKDRIEPSEVTEMGANAAILHGHDRERIYFVKNLDYK